MDAVRFVVKGVPKSVGASGRSKERWKDEVARAAKLVISGQPTSEEVALQITFFHQGRTDLDIDNIIKPISDALIGIAFADDAQVTDVRASRRSLDNELRVSEVTGDLVAAIEAAEDFVSITVRPAPDQRVLP